MIYITPSQAAQALGVTRPTVYSFIEQGKLRAQRISQKKQHINGDDLDILLGTPGLISKGETLQDLLDTAGRRAFGRNDYRCAADLLEAAEQIPQLVLQRRNWHERLVRLYDVIGYHLDDDPALQTCRDLIDSLLDTVVTPR